MADPTKQETEQVFKALQAQKGNKASRLFLSDTTSNHIKMASDVL
jgi:hypothetical protein